MLQQSCGGSVLLASWWKGKCPELQCYNRPRLLIKKMMKSTAVGVKLPWADMLLGSERRGGVPRHPCNEDRIIWSRPDAQHSSCGQVLRVVVSGRFQFPSLTPDVTSKRKGETEYNVKIFTNFLRMMVILKTTIVARSNLQEFSHNFFFAVGQAKFFLVKELRNEVSILYDTQLPNLMGENTNPVQRMG